VDASDRGATTAWDLTYFSEWKNTTLSLQLADLWSTNLDRGCNWHGCNKSLALTYFLRLEGSKWRNQILGQMGWHKS